MGYSAYHGNDDDIKSDLGALEEEFKKLNERLKCLAAQVDLNSQTLEELQ